MSRFNKIILIGTVSNTPELKQTSSGDSLCTFTLNVDRPDIENAASKSDVFIVNAWRDLADSSATLTEGSIVVVDGSIRNRSFDNDNGQRVYITEIEARSIKSISSTSISTDPSTSQTSSIPVVEESNQTSDKSFDFNEAIKTDEKSPEFVPQLGEDVPF
ncbi:hypothetical protein CL658_01440 [bacterium]|nr:hypothetical protein [bacterium]|tara:strand:+ start:60039 stop:60518 length:480 start_codon:yes stop_codon:yes gene_type:complete